jgi:hypothetical protein
MILEFTDISNEKQQLADFSDVVPACFAARGRNMRQIWQLTCTRKT